MEIFVFTFLVVFLFNLLPAFAPPTWMTLSFIVVNFRVSNLLLFVLAGTLAATLGRMLLALVAHKLIRQNFLSPRTRQSIDSIKSHLENHPKLTFSIFLLYAFGPFPSNQLFIAYGLTDLKLKYIVAPFFLGRFASYLFWVLTASGFSHKLVSRSFQTGKFFSLYFIASQIFSLLVVYFFTKIDWKKLLEKKRFGLI